MIIPIRCFTCGTVVAGAYEAYKQRRAAGEDAKKIMDDLGLVRYCCRRMIVSETDIIDDAAPYV